MKRFLAVAGCLACLVFALGSSAVAQTNGDDTRPAATTFLGDTGLWFVPTAEVLANRNFSASGHRANFDREQGFSDITHHAGTFAVGVRDRVEVFGSFRFMTRIDRDIRPLFRAEFPSEGGVLNDYPLVTNYFSGNQVSDLLVGAKFSLLSEQRLDPAAVAIRGFVKLPTGDEESGTTSGEVDGELDIVVSKVAGNVEVSGFGGFTFRSDPDNIDLANGVRWGVGVGAPVNGPIRFFGEIHGETLVDDSVTVSAPLTAIDGSLSPLLTELRSPVDVTVGVQWNSPRGIFVGAGLNWALVHDSRSVVSLSSNAGDRLGFLFRVGYHPGVKVFVPPPPPPPPAAAANRPPTVAASCNPCEVLFGEEVQLRADAQDPDGDPIDYRWSTPAGELLDPPNRATKRWRAPNQEGPVPITVTVTDGRGGSASDTVTIQVDPPPEPAREYVFEDVHFDFNRYTLRSGAARVLDEVISALGEDASLSIEIAGHTCNIGTAEYNLALGERRANSVREYLNGRGVATSRLTTVSYGEERPQHDNSREETRRLNRRAALVIRVQ